MVTQSLLPLILIEFACAALVAILAFVDVVVGVVVLDVVAVVVLFFLAYV